MPPRNRSRADFIAGPAAAVAVAVAVVEPACRESEDRFLVVARAVVVASAIAAAASLAAFAAEFSPQAGPEA